MSHPRDIPPMWLLLAIGLELVLDSWWPIAEPVVFPWTLLGLLVVVMGIVLVVWSAGLFRSAGTGIRPFTPATALVSRGPYRFSRNPMYLGLVVVLVGGALALGSLSVWAVPPAFLWLLQQRFVRREERFLLERFGDEFRECCRRVRRWL